MTKIWEGQGSHESYYIAEQTWADSATVTAKMFTSDEVYLLLNHWSTTQNWKCQGLLNFAYESDERYVKEFKYNVHFCSVRASTLVMDNDSCAFSCTHEYLL